MSALVVLIAASLFLAIGFLIAFIFATKKGQYEDIYTPSVRILFDDDIKSHEGKATSHEEEVMRKEEEKPHSRFSNLKSIYGKRKTNFES